jgi:hypothetical protein
LDKITVRRESARGAWVERGRTFSARLHTARKPLVPKGRNDTSLHFDRDEFRFRFFFSWIVFFFEFAGLALVWLALVLPPLRAY